MKSPFPGMDPFIEACGLWEDFHHALIQEIKRQLNRRLPKGYLARTGEREYVVLAVASIRDNHPGSTGVAVAETAIEPAAISVQALIEESFRETFVEVRVAESGNLVTCIEVLSTSNKRPNTEGWHVYLRKRQGLLLSGSASLIEIDLLRGGQRMPMAGPWPKSPYTLLVARCMSSPTGIVWPTYCVRRLTPDPGPASVSGRGCQP